MPHNRSIPLLAITLLGLLLMGTLPAAAGHQVALGITKSNGDESIAEFDAFTTANDGIAPKLWTLRSKWGGADKDFPTGRVQALHARGAVPVIWWSPINPGNWLDPKYGRLMRIVNGKHDAYITQWALDAKAAGGTSIVRLAHEGNVHVFPWGRNNFDNTPKLYRQAWRHVVKIFRQVGADNVDFLWSVSKQSCANCNPYKKYHPGDQWVDYVGFTAFNWGGHNGRKWAGMVKIYTQPMKKIRAFSKRPFIVAETASNHKNGNKPRWIRKGYQNVQDKWHKIRGIVYMDSNEPHDDHNHPYWGLNKPNGGAARDAYAFISAKPEFQGNLD